MWSSTAAAATGRRVPSAILLSIRTAAINNCSKCSSDPTAADATRKGRYALSSCRIIISRWARMMKLLLLTRLDRQVTGEWMLPSRNRAGKGREEEVMIKNDWKVVRLNKVSNKDAIVDYNRSDSCIKNQPQTLASWPRGRCISHSLPSSRKILNILLLIASIIKYETSNWII